MKLDPKSGTRRRSRVAILLGGGLVLATALVTMAAFGGGSAVAQAQAVPANTVEPVISGSPSVGSTLSVTDGSWSNSPTSFSRQWVRCASTGGAPDGSDCAAISGATTSAYVVGSGDAGSTLRVRVTASNSDGSSTVASNATAVVSGTAPVNSAQPAISGSARQGQTLTGSTGTWTGAGSITYAYQWLRCPSSGGGADGSGCSTISGATSATYTLQAADVGARLRLRVTATNGGGSQSAVSNATATVTSGAAAPVNTRQPAIGGTARQGAQLSADVGSWTSATGITYSVTWVRCGPSGGNADASDCAPITGATTTVYVAQAADVGLRLRVRVTARNSTGSTTVVSNATPTVAGPGTTPAPGVVPIASVSLPQRLVIDKVQFSPNPVRSRESAVQVRVHVATTSGSGVSGALVFVRSTPILTSTPSEQETGADGWATLELVPRASFPLRNGYSVQMFVRVRKAGEPLLAGVSARRLVQVGTAR